MSPVFRSGKSTDLPAVARLIFHSFPRTAGSVAEWENLLADSPHGGTETVWVGEEQRRVVAGCRLLSFRQWIGGRAIPIMGLSTVAISATDRRRGLAAQLTVSALQESRRRGELATALYPFRDSFYRKLGYGLAGEVQQYLVEPAMLPDHPARSRVRMVVLMDERAALASIYGAWAPLQTGQLQRTERAWERIWEGGSRHGVIAYDHTDKPRGYLVFRYLTEAVGGKRTLDIEEIVWLDREARLALYGWMSSLSDQWGHLLYRAHPQEGFPEFLVDHRMPLDDLPRWHHWFPSFVALNGPMFRLLDVERALAERSVHVRQPMVVALEVQDPQIPENAGRWLLELDEGRVEITRGTANRVDLELRMGIEALSRLYVGALAPSTALVAGLVEADRPERLADLDAALALPLPWTFDRF